MPTNGQLVDPIQLHKVVLQWLVFSCLGEEGRWGEFIVIMMQVLVQIRLKLDLTRTFHGEELLDR